jgi:hypothetical protein
MYSDLEQRRQAVAQRLRDLPEEVAQPYDWAEFQRRARIGRHARAGGVLRAGGVFSDRSGKKRNAAIAAGLVALLVAVAVWTRFGSSQDAPDGPALADNESASWSSMVPGSDAVITTSPDGDVTIRFTAAGRRANVVEKWLVTLPDEPVVVRVGTRAVVAGLEDRIAQLDDILSAERVEGVQPARLVVLQEQRARLVSSLAQVRYAETLAAQAR